MLNVSEKLTLSKSVLSDAKEVFAVVDSQRDYLGKWLPFIETTLKVEDSKAFIKASIGLSSGYSDALFTIRNEGVFMGMIGFKATDLHNRRTEIGYWLREEYQHRGIMTKCVSFLCELAKSELNIHRIQIKCAVGNTASHNIPKSLNFKFEGIERDGELLSDGYIDVEVWSFLQ